MYASTITAGAAKSLPLIHTPYAADASTGLCAGVAGEASQSEAGAAQRKWLSDMDLEGKNVFDRVDFNVPVVDGAVTDDFRIRNSLPTIELILNKGGTVILGSHLGRPKGRPNPEFTLEPVALHLSDLLKRPVHFAHDCVGDDVIRATSSVVPGSVVLLENLRFHKGETDNDPEFARSLARHADVYVNDAAGSMHRAHASTEGMVKLFAERAPGLLIQKELEVLAALLNDPSKPFLSLLGGVKVSDKLKVVERLMEISDAILIGGAMAFTFLHARGAGYGRSKVELDMVDEARRIMGMAEETGTRLYLPRDHVGFDHNDDAMKPVLISSKSIPDNIIALDIGPETVEAYSRIIGGDSAMGAPATILWNGPFGLYEKEAFAVGTDSMAAAIAATDAYSVVGGGNSVEAVRNGGFENDLSFLSTAGGAMLEFMSGKRLPALVALGLQ